MRSCAVFLITARFALAQEAPPDAQAVMARVAANMEASAGERSQWIYQQKVQARFLRTDGQVARQERREYLAVPGPEKTEKKLVSLAGEYHKNKKEIVRYTEPGFKKGGADLDGEIMADLVEGLVNNRNSRDGIPRSLFPLASKDLPAYKFTYRDTQQVEGRKTLRIAFEPVRKSNCLNIGDESDEDDCRTPWKGEALIDAEELQPVRIFTDTDFKMPWGVKFFLGTNLRQTGFSVLYSRLAPNVWFPASYGAEFRLDVLFGYKRVITLAMESLEFKRGDAQSQIRFE